MLEKNEIIYLFNQNIKEVIDEKAEDSIVSFDGSKKS
jgi:hypothetical protein